MQYQAPFSTFAISFWSVQHTPQGIVIQVYQFKFCLHLHQCRWSHQLTCQMWREKTFKTFKSVFWILRIRQKNNNSQTQQLSLWAKYLNVPRMPEKPRHRHPSDPPFRAKRFKRLNGKTSRRCISFPHGSSISPGWRRWDQRQICPLKAQQFLFPLKTALKVSVRVYVCVRVHTCVHKCCAPFLHYRFSYFKSLLISFQGAGIDSINDKIYRRWGRETAVQSQHLMN